jgi:hypothetical protein
MNKLIGLSSIIKKKIYTIFILSSINNTKIHVINNEMDIIHSKKDPKKRKILIYNIKFLHLIHLFLQTLILVKEYLLIL